MQCQECVKHSVADWLLQVAIYFLMTNYLTTFFGGVSDDNTCFTCCSSSSGSSLAVAVGPAVGPAIARLVVPSVAVVVAAVVTIIIVVGFSAH